jgi:3-dehydroquinate synthase
MTNQLTSNTVGIVKIEEQIFEKFSGQKIFILVDENTYLHCYLPIQKLLPTHQVIQISAGEIYKNLETCQYIWQQLTVYQADRKSVLINLGGGVIGDMGGFCAATYKRGIDFVQIPSTLLAQVDASVGGKVGIDFQHFKNHIGVFALPKAVYIDTQFLKTLPNRELRSGFAEVLKHCLIADKGMWEKIYSQNLQNITINSLDWNEVVQHSITIKQNITNQDPHEKGLRKILNFGHTIGHAIESFYLQTDKPFLHGEAIAIGMIAESYLSYKNNLISKLDFEQIKKLLQQLYGQQSIENPYIAEIVEFALQDKKNEQNTILTCLLNKIGNCIYNQAITKIEIAEALRASN